jgi:hypothetical protein
LFKLYEEQTSFLPSAVARKIRVKKTEDVTKGLL